MYTLKQISQEWNGSPDYELGEYMLAFYVQVYDDTLSFIGYDRIATPPEARNAC